MDINKENLDKAVSSSGSQSSQEGQSQPSSQQGQSENMSQEEETGFHKGSLNTLANERSELLKMAQNVEAVMQQHIKRLQDLGVDVQGADNSGQSQSNQSQ